jgi:hypothetical protein
LIYKLSSNDASARASSHIALAFLVCLSLLATGLAPVQCRDVQIATAPQSNLKTAKVKTRTKGKPAVTPQGSSDVVIDAMTRELKRSFEKLKNQGQAPLYFLSYRVCDTDSFSTNATFGAITSFNRNHNRLLDIEARVGSPELDSTHKIRSDRIVRISHETDMPIVLERPDIAASPVSPKQKAEAVKESKPKKHKK